MNTKKEFNRMMNEQNEIALATSVYNNPNVRIVNFYYDEKVNTLYFSSFIDNQKVKEFNLNPKICFTTIPKEGNDHVKAFGQVKRSNLTIFDLKKEFVEKIPDYKNTIKQVGHDLILFEIKMRKAIVTLDFNVINILEF